MIGCLIHPTIPIKKPGLHVADMGTGTAIWPLEVAEMLPPDCQIHGFDMSTAHFPRSNSLPVNVFFTSRISWSLIQLDFLASLTLSKLGLLLWAFEVMTGIELLKTWLLY
jgi:methylase of polypeptide subunit release factors